MAGIGLRVRRIEKDRKIANTKKIASGVVNIAELPNQVAMTNTSQILVHTQTRNGNYHN